MNFRTATIEDVEGSLQLLEQTIKSTCKNDYTQEQIKAWASSAQKKDHWRKFVNEHFSIIAEIDNKIVGFGSLENGDYIFFMYVHKDFLGKGIASKIYKRLAIESQRLGHNQITANVSKTAVPFFESKGFNIIKENQNIINTVTIVNYQMVNNNFSNKLNTITDSNLN